MIWKWNLRKSLENVKWNKTIKTIISIYTKSLKVTQKIKYKEREREKERVIVFNSTWKNWISIYKEAKKRRN